MHRYMAEPLPHPLRCLLDISPLGMGFGRTRMQAGIYRVAERTVAHLIGRPHLELGFTATTSPELDLASEAQLRALHPDVPLEWRSGFNRITGNARQWTNTLERARRGRRMSPDRIFAATMIRGLGFMHPPRHIPGDWDIVHSFYAALPSGDRIRSRAQALTVYDLTTITHPDTHLTSTIADVRMAVQSLQTTSNGWAVCISEYTRSELIRLLGFPARRTVVLPLGADPRFTHVPDGACAFIRKRYGIGDTPYLLCLSSMEPRKNLVRCLQAFARFTQRHPGQDLQLVLAGPPGWRNASIAEEIVRAHIPVRHIGFVDDADLPALYAGSSAFLYLSLAEGFGLPIVEAMASGAPVLASNAASIPEVAGKAGILVDPTDIEAIADGIALVLKEGSGLVAAGKEQATRFTWPRMAAALECTYRDILTGP